MADENDPKNPLRHVAVAVQRMEDLLAALPGDIAKDLRTKLGTVRGVLLEHRSPALVLVGRRGAGKSSLVNALFAAKVADAAGATWSDCRSARGTMAVLETESGEATPAPLGSTLFEVTRRAPDVLLYVVRANDVDAAADADLDTLEAMLTEVERKHRSKPPLLCVVTNADTLEPSETKLHDTTREPPRGVDEKLKKTHAAERAIDLKLRARPNLASQLKCTIAVSSAVTWRDDGTIRADERWQIPELAAEIFKLLPETARGTFARIAHAQRLEEELADTLTKAVATLCAAIGILPIPVADILPITSFQATLVMGVAWISGRELAMKNATEFLGAMGINIGVGFALREAARALMKVIAPAGAAVVTGGIAFAGTMAIGAAAKAYFIRGEPIEQVKKIYQSVKSKSE